MSGRNAPGDYHPAEEIHLSVKEDLFSTGFHDSRRACEFYSTGWIDYKNTYHACIRTVVDQKSTMRTWVSHVAFPCLRL